MIVLLRIIRFGRSNLDRFELLRFLRARHGDFEFAASLLDGSEYEVTVLTQPESPGQDCLVTRGSGVLSGADVSNVAVNCYSEDRIFSDGFE
jgi:hexokinase